MIFRFKTIHNFWRFLSFGILPKYKIDVYKADDEDIQKLKEWLKLQDMKYTSNNKAYYAADNFEDAEQYKPKITIRIRTEENLVAFKLAWL